jgi:hypothetical protein
MTLAATVRTARLSRDGRPLSWKPIFRVLPGGFVAAALSAAARKNRFVFENSPD